jgi:hypothetical protein
VTLIGHIERKILFFEKKKQKTFDCFGFGLSGYAQPRLVKVFWFFFLKKNRFLPLQNGHGLAGDSQRAFQQREHF